MAYYVVNQDLGLRISRPYQTFHAAVNARRKALEILPEGTRVAITGRADDPQAERDALDATK